MRGSWLVQRLKKPSTRQSVFGPDNPFAFGGGLRNGGLTDEAMGLLRGIFSFDYMGAAEFEFGAVPKALQGLAADVRDLTAFTVSIPLTEVPRNWRDKSKTVPTGDALVYVLCRKGHADEVRARIWAWAGEAYPHLKESLNLASTLRPVSEYDGETAGWLELDNGFFFSTDREMWAQTCDLFGVVASEVSA